jgi:hypothetical protein
VYYAVAAKESLYLKLENLELYEAGPARNRPRGET